MSTYFAVVVERRYYGNPARIAWQYEHTQHGTPRLYESRAAAMAAARELNSDVTLSPNQYSERWSTTREGSRLFNRVIGDCFA